MQRMNSGPRRMRWIIEKKSSISGAMKRHLDKDRANGHPIAYLLGQVALFALFSSLNTTHFRSKHDAEGTISALLYQICTLLFHFSKRLGQLVSFKHIPRFKTTGNVIENLLWAGLALLADKTYERSLSSLGILLSAAFFILVLLIMVEPRSEHGILTFPIGLAIPVAFDVLKLTYRFWLVVAICVVLFLFKFWLDRHVLDDQSAVSILRRLIAFNRRRRLPILDGIEALAVGIFFLCCDVGLWRNNCQIVSKVMVSVTCSSRGFLIGFVACVVILWFWVAHIIIPRLRRLLAIGIIPRLRNNDMMITFSTFSEASIKKATNNFHADNLIGEGGFFSVYKGVLADGTSVAIKILNEMDKVTITEHFQQDMAIVSRINHKNIVKLLGWCWETRVPLLVYEFVSNGTLYHHIHDKRPRVLPFLQLWRDRLRIASEIADALNYLHSLAGLPIIHGYVNSRNILLDDHYTAKVSDLGASVLLTSLNQAVMGSRVLGRTGYLDPEYLITGHLTDKSDVYSFAVVLVELLTGEDPATSARAGERRNFIKDFISAVEDHRVIRVLDFEVSGEGEAEEVVAVAELAKRCLNSSGLNRPTMGEVAEELWRLRKLSNRELAKELWRVRKLQETEETERLLGGSSTTPFDIEQSQEAASSSNHQGILNKKVTRAPTIFRLLRPIPLNQ